MRRRQSLLFALATVVTAAAAAVHCRAAAVLNVCTVDTGFVLVVIFAQYLTAVAQVEPIANAKPETRMRSQLLNAWSFGDNLVIII